MSQPQVSVWRNWVTRLNGASLLSLLLFIDIVFIVVHIWLWSRGLLNVQLNLEADGSLPEWFNYTKWAVSAFACGYAFYRSSEPLYFAWSMLFTYFLLDDAIQIHEQLGTALDFGPALALRAQDFGELAVSLAVAIVLGVMAIMMYRRTDINYRESKDFTRRQLPWLGVLVFCGVVVDMLHTQIDVLGSPNLYWFVGVVEDGGEMIAASFLTAISVRQAALIGVGFHSALDRKQA